MAVKELFDRIAVRYDFFNCVSSFGIDKSWRRKLSSKLKSEKELKVLDIATGTGEVLLSLFDNHCDILEAVGIDLSAEMLAAAEKKLTNYKVELKQADAKAIPFEDNYFDALTCAFGVRNILDLDTSLKEMLRVLKPAGKLLILEFSLPPNPLIKCFYLLYLKFYIPLLGTIITGDFAAYRYLSRTIQTFSSGKDFCRILQTAGFKDVNAEPLTFGIVTLYSAYKR